MKERTALGEAILKHWREHCPQMVQDLEKNNRLDQAVFEAQEKTGDLLYELVSVRKMDYQAAWEMATREWAFPSGEDLHPKSPPPTLREIEPEAEPPPPSRDFRIEDAHRIGAGRAEGKGPRQHRRDPRSQAD